MRHASFEIGGSFVGLVFILYRIAFCVGRKSYLVECEHSAPNGWQDTMNYEDWHPSNKVCATIEHLQYIKIATPCQIKHNAASNLI